MMLMACLAGAVRAQVPIREGAMEKLVIAPGTNPDAWVAAEATMASSVEMARTGEAALHFHIDVDHYAGEVNYPIGWPRAFIALGEPWQQNWADYDSLRLWVYTDTSRDSLPSAPLGMIIHAPDKAHSFNYTMGELVKGEWVSIEIPLTRIPNPSEVTRIQFFISESNYRHGDVVDFYIDDICLLRHAAAHVSDLAVRPRVAYSDLSAVMVVFRALGIRAEARTPATLTLNSDGNQLVRSDVEVSRGTNSIALPLGEGLAEGTYEVLVKLADTEPVTTPLRLVGSPWAQ